jgi:poly(beta-D-mannuronate) lyase
MIFRSTMALSLLLAATVASAAAGVAVPPGYRLPAQTARETPHGDCPAVPSPYTAALDIPSKYEGSDAARATENAEANARYLAATRSVSAMEKGYAALVRKYMRTGNPILLDCTMRWLNTWAEADALMNRAPTHTGRSVRKWALASLAGSYLRIRHSAGNPLRDDLTRRRQIEAWFGRLAGRVIAEWPVSDPVEQFNNHYYWSAWSLMAAAAATDRRDLFDASLGYYRVFTRQVDANGYLPAELSRKSRALSYHAYALGPLAMIAAFAKANGVDVAAEGQGALTRLADRTLAGLNAPESFAAAAGAAQDPSSLGKRSQWAWLEPYCATVSCDATRLYTRQLHARQVSTRLGGDLTALFSDSRIP